MSDPQKKSPSQQEKNLLSQQVKNLPLLQVKNLTVEFDTDDGRLRAVDHVSFDLYEGEIFGIVGESGSGKSVSCLTLMGLLPKPPAHVVAGEIIFEGRDILKSSEEELRHLRGEKISMIFQDPFSSLNPYLPISTQLMEVLETHTTISKSAAQKRCLELLDRLGIPDPKRRFESYPHQLSGGLKQRMMIAMSLLLEPKILIADEPTTALDVTIQAQILELLREINREFKTSIIFITHDLGVVAELCERVQVMYAGRVMESAAVEEIFSRPLHPYTRGLMTSRPHPNAKVGDRLTPIPGQPARLTDLSPQCMFANRCSYVDKRCQKEEPGLVIKDAHAVACFNPLKESHAS